MGTRPTGTNEGHCPGFTCELAPVELHTRSSHRNGRARGTCVGQVQCTPRPWNRKSCSGWACPVAKCSPGTHRAPWVPQKKKDRPSGLAGLVAGPCLASKAPPSSPTVQRKGKKRVFFFNLKFKFHWAPWILTLVLKQGQALSMSLAPHSCPPKSPAGPAVLKVKSSSHRPFLACKGLA